MIEINAAGELVWDFYLPDNHYIYRSEKYPVDYPAFEARDLTKIDEVFTTYDCQLLLNNNEIEDEDFSYNIDNQLIQVESAKKGQLSILDIMGRTLITSTTNELYTIVSVDNLNSGYYILLYQSEQGNIYSSKFFKP